MVALKQIKNASKENLENLIQEAKLMRAFRHTNVIFMQGIVECSSGDQYIALEYAQNGDLYSLIKKDQLQPERILRILYEISLGMNYLHKQKVLHRDLKVSAK